MANLKKYLAGVIAMAMFKGIAAHALTIVPTFDASITSDPNGAAMVAAINKAIAVFQSNIVDGVTVKILFTNDTTISLGENLSWRNSYLYSNFLAALRSHAKSLNDTNGLANLVTSLTDPLLGVSHIILNKAPARALGLTSTTGSDGYDSTIILNPTLMNLTRPPGNPGKYDMASVVEHEIDEVLGASSAIPDSTICPIDLFRYTTNLARTYTTSGDDAYFSVDGVHLLARFNMDPGGDYSDWYSADLNWAPPGSTPHPQVQDAFATPAKTLDIGPNELAMLDVLGWTLSASGTQSAPPTLKIVHSGMNQYTISWSGAASGFVLQERTNFTGSWANSPSGSANPTTITSGAAHKSYRVYNATASSVSSLKTVLPDLATSPDELHRRIYSPK